jgi:mannose-6-phosphate isomerase-like protein (cupin superfamily)
MKKILLKPHEEFIHFPVDESVLELVKGELVYNRLNQSTVLKSGELIITPAKTHQTVQNIGKSSATICLYDVYVL